MMPHSKILQIGPAVFRILSDWRGPLDQLEWLYHQYPVPSEALVDFTIRLEAHSLLRRFVRPSIMLKGDISLPDAAPLPLDQGQVSAEMGMNLHMAVGWRRHLVLHAASIARSDKAVILTGVSGSGKSTLSALLGERDWRFMGDELALLDLISRNIAPYPRAISLKNSAIAMMQQQIADPQRFGATIHGTPKGDIAHMVPNARAIAAMDQPARPILILFPSWGRARDIRQMGRDELFIRLTQAAPNYVSLGEPGFEALTQLCQQIPAYAIDYRHSDDAIEMVERLFADHQS